MRVVFSGSSILNIYKGNADLSRRAINYELFGLSFREFLSFENVVDISNKLLPLENFTKAEAMFKTYKQYENGGEVLIHLEVNRKQADYKVRLLFKRTAP